MGSKIIGITGCSGSGKSLLASTLFQLLGEDNSVIFTQDNYYIPREQQPKDEQGISNFDLPQSLFLNTYVQDLLQLQAGNVVIQNKYNYNNPALRAASVEVKSAKYIITEGLFVFYPENIRPIFDLKIFVDTAPEISFGRRLYRDETERGYDYNDVNYRFHQHVLPCYQNYILPHKEDCDYIVENSENKIENIRTHAQNILKLL